MNIAIVGSRKFPDLSRVIALVEEIRTEHSVVSGGACGVDKTATAAAMRRGINTIVLLPDYDKYGSKYAPLRRNEKIVEISDIMYAFWYGDSNGTGHAIGLAHEKGIPVHVIKA